MAWIPMIVKQDISLVENFFIRSLSKQDMVNDSVRNDEVGIYVQRCIVYENNLSQISVSTIWKCLTNIFNVTVRVFFQWSGKGCRDSLSEY